MDLVDVTFLVPGLTPATALLVPRTSVPAPIVFAGVGIGVGAAWHLVPSLPVISPARMKRSRTSGEVTP